MTNIVILIPTYLRPHGLKRTLGGISSLSTSGFPASLGCVSIHVVVADNDAIEQGGLRAAELAEQDLPFPLHKIAVGERGIPHSRNALLKYALDQLAADFVVFIDDDEAPCESWLEDLLSVQTSTGADVVGGSVSAAYEVAPPPWAAQLGLYETPIADTGLCDIVDSTANVLIRTQILSSLKNPWFNPDFALTGGSDKEFFLRMKGKGCVFAWAEKANVIETVPASRATEKWIFQRSYRVGNLDMRLILMSGSKFALAREALISISAMLVSIVMFVLFFPFKSRRITARRRMSRQAGKLAAFRGHLYEEYVTIHGR